MKNHELTFGRKTKRRILAWFLCFCMVLSCVDVTALATEVQELAEDVVTVVPDGLPAGAYTSSDVTVVPEADFGVKRLSQAYYYREPGESVIFAAYGWTSEGTITYTWSHGNEILDETSGTLVIDAVTQEDYNNSYACAISNGVKTKVYYFELYERSVLQVCWADEQYEDVSKAIGEEVTVEVEACDLSNSGNEIKYQWYEQGDVGYEAIQGANSAIYTYLCTGVKSLCCEVSCGNIVKSVYRTVEVKSEDKEMGMSCVYTYPGATDVAVRITADITDEDATYQWQKGSLVNGEWVYKDIEGATEADYVIDEMQEEDFGRYRCVATYGGVSFPYGLEIVWAPKVMGNARQSSLMEVVYRGFLNEKYQFEIEEYPSEYDVDYQWYVYDGNEEAYVVMEGETDNVLSGTFVSTDDFADRKCVMKYGDLEACVEVYISNAYNDYFNAVIPKTLEEEKAVCVPIGSSYNMNLITVEEKDANVTYQWSKCIGKNEWGNNLFRVIENATSPRLEINVDDVGDYGTYVCHVGNENYGYTYAYHICGDAKVTGVSLDYAGKGIELDTVIWLEAIVEPINAANKKVTWTSDNSDIVQIVDERGWIKGVGVGEAKLTATTEDGKFQVTCFVIVSDGLEATHEHHWSEWQIDAATCLEDGLKHRVCLVDDCPEVEEIELQATGHIMDEGTVTKVATTTEQGEMTYRCIICKTEMKVESIPVITAPPAAPPVEPPVASPVVVTPAVGEKVQDENTQAEFVVKESTDGKVEVEYKAPEDKKQTIVEIPDTITTADGTVCEVTSVANDAFKNNKNVKKVKIGDNITEIGDNAFSGCKNLTNVTIGKNVEEIGDNAFKDCGKVKKVTIPSSVQKIGDNAFSGCKNATNITIGKNVEEIGDGAFKNCGKVKKIEIPNKVEEVGDNAFNGCKGATKITIGKNVTDIGDNAFKNCDKVKKLTLPSKVTNIGNNAFDSCNKLKTITIKSSKLTSKGLDKKAFKGVGKGATIKVPKKKVDTYKKLFQKKGLNKKAKVKKA